MKNVLIAGLLVLQGMMQAQISSDSKLFKTLKTQDSLLFEKGFNQCDIEYLKKHMDEDLRFFHDQGGFQDKALFLENTEQYICVTEGKKPIRKVDPSSLEVFPLYNNGTLYAAIQKGIHHFYLREKGEKDLLTSSARFTHVWVLQEEQWLISEVLSYDHQSPE